MSSTIVIVLIMIAALVVGLITFLIITFLIIRRRGYVLSFAHANAH
jgi:hypothetical protein